MKPIVLILIVLFIGWIVALGMMISPPKAAAIRPVDTPVPTAAAVFTPGDNKVIPSISNSIRTGAYFMVQGQHRLYCEDLTGDSYHGEDVEVKAWWESLTPEIKKIQGAFCR